MKATSKRKAHYRTIEVGRKDNTVKDEIAKISTYARSGNVDLPGVSIEDLNQIRKGLDVTLGKYSMKVDTISFGTQVPDAQGLYSEERDSIEYTRDKFISIREDVKTATDNFKRYTQEDKDEVEGFIERGKLSPEKDQEMRGRLMRLNALTRINAMCDIQGNKVIYALTVHEAHHKLLHESGLEAEWTKLVKEKMKIAGVNVLYRLPAALSVSEYGANSIHELFPEIGAALTLNLPIDDEMKEIYNQIMERIKK